MSSSSGPEQKRRRTKGADDTMSTAAKAKEAEEEEEDEEEEEEKRDARDGELKDLIVSLRPDGDDDYKEIEAIAASLRENIQRVMDGFQRTLRQKIESLPSLGDNPGVASAVSEIMEREVNNILGEELGDIPDPKRSKLTEEKRAEIKRLIDAGASLSRVDALHISSSFYKQSDLFDLLIDEYGLGVEDPDHTSLSSPPLHVAACTGNCQAIEILLAKGAVRKSRNSKGRTALQEVAEQNRKAKRSLPSFMFEQFRRETNVDKVSSLLH